MASDVVKEGIIKYDLHYEPSEALPEADIAELNEAPPADVRAAADRPGPEPVRRLRLRQHQQTHRALSSAGTSQALRHHGHADR